MAHTLREIPTSDWVACPECDLLQREPGYLRRRTVVCARCEATLYRSAPGALEITLAAMVGAGMFFAFANAFPFMSLELQGRTTEGTLLELALALHRAGMTSVGALVLFTLVLMPALQIAAFLYLIGPLRFGIVLPGFTLVARALQAAKPWSMVEVFLLAALVSIGKLEESADLELGPGFWCTGVVMFLFALTDTFFDPRDLWDRAVAVRAGAGQEGGA